MQSQAKAAIEAAQALSHPPRATLAAMIQKAKLIDSNVNTEFHQNWINRLFHWKGDYETMFKYYSRGHDEIQDLQPLPLNAIRRACWKEGWKDEKMIKKYAAMAVSLPHRALPVLSTTNSAF